MSDPFPDEIDDAYRREARRRADAIRSYLERNTNRSTTANVAELATEFGLSLATGLTG